MDRITGLMNAPAPKRYKSFCVTCADTEEVWLLPGKPVCVWQDKELAERCCPDEEFACMEVHDFCRWLEEHACCSVRVCPNGRDCTDIPAEKLLEDLQEELDLLE